MTSNIINFIVEKFLAEYLEIDTSQTSASLWSGIVEMSNLKINKNLFKKLNLPYLELVDGYIGKLSLKLSMPRFYLYPIKVKIEKVFVHAKQKELSTINQQEQIKEIEDYKQSKLLSQEQLYDEINQLKTESAGMVQQIINNLTIDITDIVFRFDDSVSYPRIPFSLGIMFHNFIIYPTTETFEINRDKPDTIPYSEINHKVIVVDDLSIFMDCYKNTSKDSIDYNKLIVDQVRDAIDPNLKNYLKDSFDFYSYCQSELDTHIHSKQSHQYLLYKLDLEFRVSLNDNVKNTKPKAQASLQFRNIELYITLTQISTLFKFLAFINLNSYYRLGIAKEYYTKTISETEKNHYMEKYVEYYKQKYIDKDKNASFPENLSKVEEGLTYEQIQSMRTASLMKLNYINEIAQIDAEIKGLESAWFYKDTKKINELKEKKEKLLKTEGNLDKQIQTQLKTQKTVTVEVDEYFDLPDSYVLYLAKIQIDKMTFSIYDTMNLIEGNANNQQRIWKPLMKIVDLTIDKFLIEGHIRKVGQLFIMSIGNITASQSKVKNKNFQNIIKGETTEDPESKLLYIEFENNPHFEKSNYRAKIITERSLYIIANLYSIQFIQHKVLSAMSNSINFREIGSYARDQHLIKYIREGYVDQYMSGDFQHFNIDLDISIESPIILLPQNVNDEDNNNAIYVSLGKLTFVSKLPPRQQLNVDYTAVQDPNLMFDEYVVKLLGAKMSTLYNCNAANNYNGEEKIMISDFNIDIDLKMSLEGKNPHFDNMIIEIVIDQFDFALTEKQILFLVFYLEVMNREGHILRHEIEEDKEKQKNELGKDESYNEQDEIKIYMNQKGEKVKKEEEEKQEEAKQKEKEKINNPLLQNNFLSILAKGQNDKKATFTKISSIEDIKQMKKTLSFVFTLNKVKLSLNKNYPDNSYNEYLIFEFNRFVLETYFTEPGDILVGIKITDINLFDNDLDENKQPLTTDNFKCLISSTQNDNQSYFLDIVYLGIKETNTSEITLEMNKLVMCVSFDSLARLYRFGMFYLGRYNESGARVAEFAKRFEKDSKQIIEEDKKEKQAIKERLQKGINTKCFENVKKYLKKDLQNKFSDKKLLADVNLKTEKKEQKRQDEIADLKAQGKTKTETVHSKMSIVVSMNHIEFNVPLDPTKNSTPIVSFNFNLSYVQKSETKVNNVSLIETNQLIEQEFLIQNSDMNVILNRVDLDIVYIKPDDLTLTRSIATERLLSNFRMTVQMGSFIVPKNEISVTDIELLFEPLLLNFGFRQIRRLMDFKTSAMKFLNEDMKQTYQAFASFEEEEEMIANIDNEGQTSKLAKLKGLKGLQQMKTIAKRALAAEKMKKDMQVMYEKIKQKNKIIINTADFNQHMDIILRMDKCSLTLFDNTSFEKRVLLDIELTKLLLKFISNSDPGDGTNFGNALIEMISNKQIPMEKYNIQTLYQYCNISFSFEIYYYNITLNDFEPFIEPFSTKIEMRQVAQNTRNRIDVTSNQMINVNISSNSVIVLNLFLIKFNEDEAKWVQPINEGMFSKTSTLKLRKALSKEIDNDNYLLSNQTEAKEDLVLQFINQTGVDLTFWFDTNKDNKISLPYNETVSYTKTSLSRAQGPRAKKNKIMKDKFSFTLLNSVNVNSIDFTCGSSHNYKLEVLIEGKKRYIECNVQVRASGIVKNVVFESSIYIYNDTKFEHLSIEYADSEIPLPKKTRVNVPITWMINSTDKVYLKLHNEKQCLFEKNILDICLKGDNYNKVELDRIQREQQRQKNNKKETYNYDPEELINMNDLINLQDSKILKFQDILSTDNNAFAYLCCDYAAFASKDFDQRKRLMESEYNIEDSFLRFNNKSKGELKGIIPGLKQIEPSYEYEITIRPCLSFTNSIPFNLSYTSIYNTAPVLLTKTAKGIVYNIKPDDTDAELVLTLHYNNREYSSSSQGDNTFVVNKDNENIILTGSASSTDVNNNLINNNTDNLISTSSSVSLDTEDSLLMKSKKSIHELSKRYNTRLMKVAFHSTLSVQFLFYFEYLITNRLNIPLFIIPSAAQENKNKESNYTITKLHPCQVNILSFPTKETKMIIKTLDTSWSTPFDIHTQGMDGVITLEKTIDIISPISPSKDKKNKDKQYTTSTDLAIIISTSKYFLDSTLVLFEQRYLIINHLGFDVTYKQENEDVVIKLPDNSEQELLYQGEKRIYTIQIGDNSTGPFDVKNVEDFDLKVKIPNDDITKYPKKNVFTYDNNQYYLLLRVINQTYDNGLIYIMLTLPTTPYYEIENKTNSKVKITENKNIEPIEIGPLMTVPFVWTNTLEIESVLGVEIFKENKTFSFSNFDKKIFEIKEEEVIKDTENTENTSTKFNCVLSVGAKNNNKTRYLKIEHDEIKETVEEKMKKYFLRRPQLNRYNVSLKGIGLSIINDTPQEIFYMSFYQIDINYTNNNLTSKNKTKNENTQNIIFYLKNFQIDYCLNDSFKSILYPKTQIIPVNEPYFKENEIEVVPFISVLITQQSTTNITSKENIVKYPQIDLIMQEFNIKIEQYAINSLLDVISNYSSLMTYLNATESNENVDIIDEPNLNTKVETPIDKLCSENENKNMMLINYLLVAALKISITLRVDISYYNIKSLPKAFMNIIGVLGNSICRITDSTLSFKEMICENIFTDFNKIISLLIEHYKKEGIGQIYKILGSSDLIGNPTKLIENIGTGFIELFNEPRKGFLKGPSQFGKGLAKGVASLFSGVVGGSFDAIGKITGTLLSATKTIQGKKPEAIIDEEDEPQNLLAGTFEGIKGTFLELGKGLSGIFLNPYKYAKKDGIKGFFKGLGTGLLGAIIAPISAILKLTNSIAVGIKNTAMMLTRSPLKTVRFRHPRVIKEGGLIREYDETYGEGKELLYKLVNESTNNILYCKNFKSGDKGFEKHISTVILTDKTLVVIYNMEKVIFKLSVKDITECFVHFVEKMYIIGFRLGEGENSTTRGFKFKEEESNVCCGLYDILNEMVLAIRKKKEGNDKDNEEEELITEVPKEME